VGAFLGVACPWDACRKVAACHILAAACPWAPHVACHTVGALFVVLGRLVAAVPQAVVASAGAQAGKVDQASDAEGPADG
jgi:hypothetical protein